MQDVSRDPEAYAQRLGVRLPADPLDWRPTPSGALVSAAGGVLLKAHAARTDGRALDRRLGCAVREGQVLLAPLHPTAVRAPGSERLVSAWPLVAPLHPDAAEHPWAGSGRLLARLHRATPARGLPRHGAADRVVRAARRIDAAGLEGALPVLLRQVAARLTEECSLARRREGACHLVHGDWHLGQVARTAEGLRLLDVDDLGAGDPAWDLGRPAGFWAAGLLAAEDWEAFLAAYRAAGGPAVPSTGDPWPRLDLSARCAVLVGAVQQLLARTGDPGGPDGRGLALAPDAEALEALSAACSRM